MSVENSVATGAPKTAAQATSGHGHGKPQAGAAAPGGFAALLMGMDDAAVPSDGVQALPGEEDKPAKLPAAVEAHPVSPDAGASAGNAAALAAVVPPTVPPTPALTSLPAAVAGSDKTLAAVRAGHDRADTLAAEPDPAAPGRKDLPLGTETPAADARASDLQPLLRQAALAQRMAQTRAQADGADGQGGKETREARGHDTAARLGWQVSDRPLTAGNPAQILLATGAGELGARPLERRQERHAAREAGAGEVGALLGQPAPDGMRADVVPAAAPDAGLMTETRVAEQVSYWVSHGVQNAELELDGPGEGKVNVAIKLQGQEARVEFRADQVQTRQVLQDSMPHLRELLAREGLVLSGVSVGSSGADGGANRQSQGRQGGNRQTLVAVPELAATATSARTALPPGRSVDLFV
jgi:flagellar hook-length control protein FliK